MRQFSPAHVIRRQTRAGKNHTTDGVAETKRIKPKSRRSAAVFGRTRFSRRHHSGASSEQAHEPSVYASWNRRMNNIKARVNRTRFEQRANRTRRATRNRGRQQRTTRKPVDPDGGRTGSVWRCCCRCCYGRRRECSLRRIDGPAGLRSVGGSGGPWTAPNVARRRHLTAVVAAADLRVPGRQLSAEAPLRQRGAGIKSRFYLFFFYLVRAQNENTTVTTVK